MTTSTKHSLRLATLVVVGLVFLVPTLLESQRRGGGGGGKGGGGHVSSGSSVRQSRAASKPTPQHSSASQPSPQRSTASSTPSASANRPSGATRQSTPSTATTGNQANRATAGDRAGAAGNRATNIDQSKRTDIQNKNVNGDRDFDNADFDNVENVHISGEEHNVWVNEGEIHVYEDYDGWKVFAGATAAIAVGTMLTRPPVGYTTVYVGPTPYYYYDNAYYTQVYSGGYVAYQVVAPPAGAIITTLPSGCVQNGAYWTCGSVYYQRSGSGYAVITNPF